VFASRRKIRKLGMPGLVDLSNTGLDIRLFDVPITGFLYPRFPALFTMQKVPALMHDYVEEKPCTEKQ